MSEYLTQLSTCGLTLFRNQIVITFRAIFVRSGQVAVFRADRERRCDGDIGQTEVAQGPPHQLLAGIGAGDTFGHIQMQHGAAGIFALQFILLLQCLEWVVGKTHRQLAGVSVIRHLPLTGLDDVTETLAVWKSSAAISVCSTTSWHDEFCSDQTAPPASHV